jgi:hypothetical protein
MNCISGRQRQSTSSGVINCGVEVWEPQFVAERSTYLAAITTVTTCSSTSRRYCCEFVLVLPVHVVVVVCILLGFLQYLPVQYSNTLLQPYVLCNPVWIQVVLVLISFGARTWLAGLLRLANMRAASPVLATRMDCHIRIATNRMDPRTPHPRKSRYWPRTSTERPRWHVSPDHG